MAPTPPRKRPSIRSKTSKSGSGLICPSTSSIQPSTTASSLPSSTLSEPTFINSKKDRRTIKHSAFLSRIEKTSKKPLKRRRPSKKLVTTLESLADALPSVSDLVEGDGKGGLKSGKMGKRGGSLKSKPGAMKRKEKLERGERERFGRNLAVIMGSRGEGEVKMGDAAPVPDAAGTAPPHSSATAGRFAALRAWVSTNMEKHPAFEKGEE